MSRTDSGDVRYDEVSGTDSGDVRYDEVSGTDSGDVRYDEVSGTDSGDVRYDEVSGTDSGDIRYDEVSGTDSGDVRYDEVSGTDSGDVRYDEVSGTDSGDVRYDEVSKLCIRYENYSMTGRQGNVQADVYSNNVHPRESTRHAKRAQEDAQDAGNTTTIPTSQAKRVKYSIRTIIRSYKNIVHDTWVKYM